MCKNYSVSLVIATTYISSNTTVKTKWKWQKYQVLAKMGINQESQTLQTGVEIVTNILANCGIYFSKPDVILCPNNSAPVNILNVYRNYHERGYRMLGQHYPRLTTAPNWKLTAEWSIARYHSGIPYRDADECQPWCAPVQINSQSHRVGKASVKRFKLEDSMNAKYTTGKR